MKIEFLSLSPGPLRFKVTVVVAKEPQFSSLL